VWRPVAYRGLSNRLQRQAVVLHTNGAPVSGGSLYTYWKSIAASGRTLGAHFQIARSGRIEQYVDTDYVLGHAWDANRFAIGIETEDQGHPERPWTDAQVNAIVALLKELKVPDKLLSVTPSDGLGWHAQYADWNKSHHSCPGVVRVGQIHKEVRPRLGEDEMTPEEKRQLAVLYSRERGRRMRAEGAPRPTSDTEAQRGWDNADALAKGAAGPHTHNFMVPEHDGVTGT
jgi:N-acetylmuramoyl-L-alanine amidase-like protein